MQKMLAMVRSEPMPSVLVAMYTACCWMMTREKEGKYPCQALEKQHSCVTENVSSWSGSSACVCWGKGWRSLEMAHCSLCFATCCHCTGSIKLSKDSSHTRVHVYIRIYIHTSIGKTQNTDICMCTHTYTYSSVLSELKVQYRYTLILLWVIL